MPGEIIQPQQDQEQDACVFDLEDRPPSRVSSGAEGITKFPGYEKGSTQDKYVDDRLSHFARKIVESKDEPQQPKP